MPSGVYKRKKEVKYKGSNIKHLEELRNFIKENNITKEQILDTILSMFK